MQVLPHSLGLRQRVASFRFILSTTAVLCSIRYLPLLPTFAFFVSTSPLAFPLPSPSVLSLLQHSLATTLPSTALPSPHEYLRQMASPLTLASSSHVRAQSLSLPLDSSLQPPSLKQPPALEQPISDAGTYPLRQSHDAVILVAIVEQCCQGQPLTTVASCQCFRSGSAPANSHSLLINHFSAPNHHPNDPVLATAKDAITAATAFIFPSDIPQQLDPEPELAQPHPVSAPPMSGASSPDRPPPLLLPHLRSAPPPTSPLSDFAAPSPFDNQSSTLARDFDAARTLPTSSADVYDALTEPAGAPSRRGTVRFSRTMIDRPALRRRPPRASRTFTVSASSPEAFARQAHTLLRRPSSSPPPRIRSTGLPAFAKDLSIRTNAIKRVDEAKAARSKRIAFRRVLLSARTHVFAITAKDGTRQYAYSRPLSSSHALVILTKASHTAVYVSAMERTAARYAYLVDEMLERAGISFHAPIPRNGLHRRGRQRVRSAWLCSKFSGMDVLRCPPQTAKELCRSLLSWLGNPSPNSSMDFVAESLRGGRGGIGTHDSDSDAAFDATDGDEEPNSSNWLTSSTTSSGLMESDDRDTTADLAQFEGLESGRDALRSMLGKDRSHPSQSPSSSRLEDSLPWESPLDGSEPELDVERILELADSTILLRHFPARAILSIMVALLEERRVCIVGRSTSLVSRAVLAVDNLLRPFEWLHLLSPILLEHMLPVLGAPFPFLVGILEEHLPVTKDLPLDNVLFADLASGKVNVVGDMGDLLRRVPRRLRSRFERRLARTKTTCMRQVNRAMSMLFVPVISNTATSFCEDGASGKVKSGPLLWRSKSQSKLSHDDSPQNIWLNRDCIAALDKSMRKFFAELLEDLPSLRADVDICAADGILRWKSGDAGRTVPLSMGNVSAKRELERRQLFRAFCETQMFMQWDDSTDSDVTFGLSHPESVLKKRGSIREPSLFAKKSSHDGVDSRRVKSATVQFRPAIDRDEVDGSEDERELHGLEKAFLRPKFSKRKWRGPGGRWNVNSETEEADRLIHSSKSGYESANGKVESDGEILRSGSRTMKNECEAGFESDTGPKRPWMTLRLPTSPWSLSRDAGGFFSGRDDEDMMGIEAGLFEEEVRSDCDDSDDFTGDEGIRSRQFPHDENALGWKSIRYWGRRR